MSSPAGARHVRAVVALSGLLTGSIVLAVGIGPVAIAPGDVVSIIGHHLLGWPSTLDSPATNDAIVWQLRVPRVLLGAVVGAGLATAGVALQAMTRNSLADPTVLGVTAGASTGAAAAILFGLGSALGANSLAVTAFAGGLAAMAAVLAIARSGGAVTPLRLLLAGMTVGYALSAATNLLIFLSDSPEGTRAVLFWLLGSLTQAAWSTLPLAAAGVAACIAALIWWGRQLDVLAIGDETARSLGVVASRARTRLLVVVALIVGVSVAVAGGIGFVGLVIPHIARRFAGSVHRRSVPVAALIGATFLIWSDALARVVLQPRELPIGVVTAIVGAPFLVSLVRRHHTLVA